MNEFDFQFDLQRPPGFVGVRIVVVDLIFILFNLNFELVFLIFILVDIFSVRKQGSWRWSSL